MLRPKKNVCFLKPKQPYDFGADQNFFIKLKEKKRTKISKDKKL